MVDYELATLEQKLKESPDDIQEMVSSPETLAFVESLGASNGLSEEVVLALTDIVTHTLLGLSNPRDLLASVTTLVGDATRAKTIVRSLYEHIFAPVEGSLATRYALTGSLSALLFPETTPSSPITPPAAAPKLPTPPVAPAVPQAPTQPTSMFEEKLKRVFTVPREESRVASTPAAPKAPLPPVAPRPAGGDPYREPLA